MKSELEERFDGAVNKAVEEMGGMQRCYGDIGDIAARGEFLHRVENIAKELGVEFTELSEGTEVLQISYQQKGGEKHHCRISIPRLA